VFDDPEFGLVEEPLILGMTEMIDAIIGPADHAVVQFTPGARKLEHTLIRKEAHEDGYYYRLEGTDLRGWLCPATLHYFPGGHPDSISLSIARVEGPNA
jgi:hypothetical protein